MLNTAAILTMSGLINGFWDISIGSMLPYAKLTSIRDTKQKKRVTY